MAMLQETRHNLHLHLPPKTRAETIEVRNHLATGMSTENFLRTGTLVCEDGTELYVPVLHGVLPGLHFGIVGQSDDLLHLAVYEQKSNQPRQQRPVLNIYPDSMAIVETHEDRLQVGVFGYIREPGMGLENEFRVMTSYHRRGSHRSVFPKVDLKYHPQRVELLRLKISKLQNGIPDSSNFVLLGEKHEVIPIRSLRFVARSVLALSQVA